MYSWVPLSDVAMLRKNALARIRSACSSSAALRRTTSTNAAVGVEHHRPQLAAEPVSQSASRALGRSGPSRLRVRGRRETAGRVDRDDHDSATAPRRLDPEGRCRRGLADPAGAAAHDHRRPRRRRPPATPVGRGHAGHCVAVRRITPARAEPAASGTVTVAASRATASRSSGAADDGDVELAERAAPRPAARSPRVCIVAALVAERGRRDQRVASGLRRANAAGSSPSDGRALRRTTSTPFTITGPSLTPTRSSSANAVSIVSFTGVVSASVTSTTLQRAGIVQHARTRRRPACAPGRSHTASRKPGRRRQHRDGVTGGRAVDDDRRPSRRCARAA